LQHFSKFGIQVCSFFANTAVELVRSLQELIWILARKHADHLIWGNNRWCSVQIKIDLSSCGILLDVQLRELAVVVNKRHGDRLTCRISYQRNGFAVLLIRHVALLVQRNRQVLCGAIYINK